MIHLLSEPALGAPPHPPAQRTRPQPRTAIGIQRRWAARCALPRRPGPCPGGRIGGRTTAIRLNF